MTPSKKHLKNTVITLLVILGIAAALWAYWKHKEKYPQTDDAYIQAHVVHVAAQVSGPVKTVSVKNLDRVKKNQLLFTVDPQPFQIAAQKAQAQLQLADQQMHAAQDAVKAAEAGVAQSQAQFSLAQKNAKRISTLVAQGKVSKAQGDEANSQLEVTKAGLTAAQSKLQEVQQSLGSVGDQNAQIQAARATLNEANLQLQYAQLKAPINGQLINFGLREGSMIIAGQPLFDIVETEAWWVDAHFKETELSRIRPGQKATIKIDLYPHKTFHGIVESISPGSGSAFSLLPAENATGNWIKVTQRFTVKISIQDPDASYPFRMGASSVVKIDTTSE